MILWSTFINISAESNKMVYNHDVYKSIFVYNASGAIRSNDRGARNIGAINHLRIKLTDDTSVEVPPLIVENAIALLVRDARPVGNARVSLSTLSEKQSVSSRSRRHGRRRRRRARSA